MSNKADAENLGLIHNPKFARVMDFVAFVFLLAGPLCVLIAPWEDGWQAYHGGHNLLRSISNRIMLLDIVPFVAGVCWFAYRHKALGARLIQFRPAHPLVRNFILCATGIVLGLGYIAYYRAVDAFLGITENGVIIASQTQPPIFWQQQNTSTAVRTPPPTGQ